MHKPAAIVALWGVLTLIGCGSVNYRDDLGALARSVEKAEHGLVTRIKCQKPSQEVRKLEEVAHTLGKLPLHQENYACSGKRVGVHGNGETSIKFITVSKDGKTWRGAAE